MKIKQQFKNKTVAEKYEQHLQKIGLKTDFKEEDGVFEVASETSFAQIDKDDPSYSEGPNKEFKGEMISLFDSFANYMQNSLNYMWGEIDYLYSMIYEHRSEGHLPPIKGAEKMKNAMEILGIAEDYEISKPVIYAKKKDGVYSIAGMSLPKQKDE